ncbi:MAG: NAD(P)H-binding protein [Bacteroidota bacterium]
MRIFVLGGSGRTGKQILSQSLDRGHHVQALVRNPDKISLNHPNLQLIKGDPALENDIIKGIEACEVVLSCLNISRRSDFPWARLRTPESFLSETMQRIIHAMHLHQIRRIIVVSAWGVRETFPYLPGWFQFLIKNSNIGVAYTDHEKQEAMLERQNLDWTIVRPVGLTSGRNLHKTRISIDNQPKPNLLISRAQLAAFMLDIMERKQYFREFLTVSSEK